MAHAKDHVKNTEWAKHLRPFGKKQQNQKERRAAKVRIKKDEE